MSAYDDPSLGTYRAVVDEYLERFGREVSKESEWFGPRCRTLQEAISRACLSAIPSGRGKTLIRHSHQRRIPGIVLVEAAIALQHREDAVARCGDFDSLYELVDETIGPIPGAGELLVYDVAQRLGSYLQFEPLQVYLHTGTRAGAKALGLSTTRKSLELSELPTDLQRLSAAQIEDVLCIYRGVLARLY